jgi:hypothetical protein
MNNLHEKLQALAHATPRPDGWADVQARIAGRRRALARRTLGLRIAAAASVALVAITASWRVAELTRERPEAMAAVLTPLTAEEALALDRVAQLRTQSSALEEALAAIGERPVVQRAGTALPIETLEAQVQWLDHQLLVAHDEIAPGSAEQLWRRRVEAMNSLVQLRFAEAQSIDM